MQYDTTGAQDVLIFVSLFFCRPVLFMCAPRSAIRQSNCFRRSGAGAHCDAPGTVLMLAFGVVQVVLSQFPGLEHITWLSVVAAVMSFAYSFIGLGLSVGQWVSHGGGLGGRIAGAAAASPTRKLWNVLLALGNIAFAYTFAEVLIEIQVGMDDENMFKC
jgi:hypothetical protein